MPIVPIYYVPVVPIAATARSPLCLFLLRLLCLLMGT
jgi:hypothetical protein